MESGIIQIELLNQKNVGDVISLFHLKTQENFHRFVQLEMQSQL